MRRKSERAKASPSVKQPESVPTRRTTRRNKKSPEKSITEEDSDNSSGQASDSDNDVQEVVTTKRAKRLSRAEKSVIDEVKERPTRGKRKTSVRSNETNEDDSASEAPTTAATNKPETIAEEEKSENVDKQHDNGSGENAAEIQATAENVAEKPDAGAVADRGGDTTNANAADGDGGDANDAAVAQTEVKSADTIDSTDEGGGGGKVGDGGDVDAQKTDREVIPEEAGDAVDIPSTAESASSSNHTNELNDFSATAAVACNKTNNISERTVDGTSKDNSRKEVAADAAATPVAPAPAAAAAVTAPAAATDDDRIKRCTDGEKTDESSHLSRSAARKNELGRDRDSVRSPVEHRKERKSLELIDDKEKENSPKPNTPAKPIVRKRKWLSSKNLATRKEEIAISSDSLKGLIPDVKPVPLSDINLESNSEPETEEPTNEIESESDDEKSLTRTISIDSNRRSEERIVTVVPTEAVATINAASNSLARKVSIVPDANLGRPPSPAKYNPSCILYITNLVRPFTALQLRGLLARTGKIVDNGFWMDKIKSKCYVKFETEDEAVETRHALHGVQWPSSNPKCLNVDFGSESQMERAIASTNEDVKPAINLRDDRSLHPWDRNEAEREKILAVEKPVREWDLGKKADTRRGRETERDDKEHLRENLRGANNLDRDFDRDRGERSDRNERNERPGERGDRRRRSLEKRRHSESTSPGRKFARKDNEPPLRLLDDLFRKTKATPCIYWLPLTPEQIAIKEEARQKQLAEHQRRIDALKKERAERELERDRERDRDRNRDRRDSSRSSRDRGGRDNRRRH